MAATAFFGAVEPVAYALPQGTPIDSALTLVPGGVSQNKPIRAGWANDTLNYVVENHSARYVPLRLKVDKDPVVTRHKGSRIRRRNDARFLIYDGSVNGGIFGVVPPGAE